MDPSMVWSLTIFHVIGILLGIPGFWLMQADDNDFQYITYAEIIQGIFVGFVPVLNWLFVLFGGIIMCDKAFKGKWGQKRIYFNKEK